MENCNHPIKMKKIEIISLISIEIDRRIPRWQHVADLWRLKYANFNRCWWHWNNYLCKIPGIDDFTAPRGGGGEGATHWPLTLDPWPLEWRFLSDSNAIVNWPIGPSYADVEDAAWDQRDSCHHPPTPPPGAGGWRRRRPPPSNGEWRVRCCHSHNDMLWPRPSQHVTQASFAQRCHFQLLK